MITNRLCLIRERRAVLASCLLVALAIGMFLFTLDRYPSSYFDEPWFNVSASRLVDGRNFVWTVDSRAPHAGAIFNPHAPFFPHFQVLTFKWMGVSHFACRLPSYLGAHLAVLLLCIMLARRHLPVSAVLLAAFWIGDKSIEYGLLGRPEGVSHLFVVVSFLTLVEAVVRQRTVWLCLAGLSLGLAVGFNPGAAFFGPALLLAVGLFFPRGQWLKILGWLAAGGALPLGLMVGCWLPDVRGSLEQFWWFCKVLTEGSVGVWGMLRWAKGLYACLAVMTVGVLLPLAVRTVRSCRHVVAPPVPNVGDAIPSGDSDWPDSSQAKSRLGEPLLHSMWEALSPAATRLPESAGVIGVCATLFALAGLSLFIDPSRRSYYLVYFSIWPVVAFLVFAELAWRARFIRAVRRTADRQEDGSASFALQMTVDPGAGGRGSCSRRGNAVAVCMVVAGGILFACWLPSLAWNIMRVRESALWWRALDRKPVVEDLRAYIQPGAEVWGAGEYFVMARDAGLVFTPLCMGWNDAGITAPERAWLVLSPEFIRRARQHNPGMLDGRAVVYEGMAFKGARHTEQPYVIYGPSR